MGNSFGCFGAQKREEQPDHDSWRAGRHAERSARPATTAVDRGAAQEHKRNTTAGPGITRESHYTDWQCVGTGGYGMVYRATDKRTGEVVAIKKIERSLVDDYVEQECLNLARCQHNQIIQFFELFLTATHLNLVMEYADGGDMHAYMQVHHRLPESEARWLFQQIVVAIDYCHSQLDVVNRDIKLENTLLVQASEGKRKTYPPPFNGALIKICDFGASKSKLVCNTINVGTPGYGAPEIIMTTTGDHDGRKLDVWSAGVVLYVMVCGEHPFLVLEDLAQEEPSYTRTYRNIARGAFTYPKELEVSSELRDLLSQIFKVEPTERISVDGIFQHLWFQQDLPPAAAQRDYGVNVKFELESDIRAIVRSANPGHAWRD